MTNRFDVTNQISEALERTFDNVRYDETNDVSTFYVPSNSRFEPDTRVVVVDSYAAVIASTGKMTFFEFVDYVEYDDGYRSFANDVVARVRDIHPGGRR